MVNNVEIINFTFAQKINRNFVMLQICNNRHNGQFGVNLVCCKFATAGIMVNNRITITQSYNSEKTMFYLFTLVYLYKPATAGIQ